MRSASKSGRIVCLLSLVDTDGLPILVAIQPNGRGNHKGRTVRSNFITSIYGRVNVIRFVKEAARRDNLMHIDDKQIIRLDSLSALQLRGALSSLIKKIPHLAKDAQVKNSQIRDSKQRPRQRRGRRGR